MLIVGNHHLFADAEIRKYGFQDVVGGDFARDRAEMVHDLANVFAQKVGRQLGVHCREGGIQRFVRVA